MHEKLFHWSKTKTSYIKFLFISIVVAGAGFLFFLPIFNSLDSQYFLFLPKFSIEDDSSGSNSISSPEGVPTIFFILTLKFNVPSGVEEMETIL
mmetsp:Transcript_13433/g.18581  ORF Transcript_13433/g.18581 Transcript_13433/m.18581 type:complete len:94 (-) Transcript_13433:624-905(-)